MSRKWIWKPGHPKANERGFVDWDDYQMGTEKRALDAPVLAGRFYENVQATDGTDIGSRAKHRDYMKRNNVAIASDFSPQWYENLHKERERSDDRDRHEAVARATHTIFDRRK